MFGDDMMVTGSQSPWLFSLEPDDDIVVVKIESRYVKFSNSITNENLA